VSKAAQKPNLVAILQARMGSTRCPGKVMEELAGRPMLEQILHNIGRSRLVTRAVVATTQQARDDVIVQLAQRMGIASFRGSESDVLDRYYRCACVFGAEVVVRLTADNPLVDGTFIDWCLQEYLSANPPVDYLDTSSSKTFPVGLSVEVFRFLVLETAWREDADPSSREHVTPYIRNHPVRFLQKHLSSRRNDSYLRWTVDTRADLEHVRRIYEEFQLAERPLAHPEIVDRIRERSGFGAAGSEEEGAGAGPDVIESH
jgi:spore coat polysaccharide biosynthesis protein SpsF